MRARFLWLTAAIVILLVAPQAVMAQGALGGYYQGHSDNPNGPTVSPYLNLLQNNSVFSQASNYQSLVKPLIDQNAAIQRQGGAINRLQQQVNPGASSGRGGGRGTGHTTYFMNYSHYYPAMKR